MNESEFKIFFFLIAGIVVGIYLFFLGFRIWSKKKLIENIPTSSVRGMAVGLVEVQGKAVVFTQPLQSHFTKAECVFFQYKVEELRRSGKSSRWVTIASYTSPHFFHLEDETGKVLINPIYAELFLRVDRQFRSGWGGAGQKELEAGLAELGIDTANFLGIGKSLRCMEIYIAPGDHTYVIGTACPDGIIETKSTQGCENLCIRKDGKNFFCISDRSEKELLGSLIWKMMLCLYGGPILTLGCLYGIVQYFWQRLF